MSVQPTANVHVRGAGPDEAFVTTAGSCPDYSGEQGAFWGLEGRVCRGDSSSTSHRPRAPARENEAGNAKLAAQ